MSCTTELFALTTLDQQRAKMAKDWPPGTLYRVSDMQTLLEATGALLGSAGNSITASIAAGLPAGDRDALKIQTGHIDRRFAESHQFIDALHAARSANVKIIDSPAFKRWVLMSMAYASAAAAAAKYVQCRKPAVVRALQTFQSVFNGVVAFVERMVEVTIAAGEAVLAIPDTIGRVVKYSMYAGLAVAAYYLIKPRKRPNPRRRR